MTSEEVSEGETLNTEGETLALYVGSDAAEVLNDLIISVWHEATSARTRLDFASKKQFDYRDLKIRADRLTRLEAMLRELDIAMAAKDEECFV